MISSEIRAEARRLFYVKHFTIHAISEALGIHRDTVAAALETERMKRGVSVSELDRFEGKIRETLEIYPKLHGSRIYAMLKDQGYRGSLRHLRRRIDKLRPSYKERFYVRNQVIAGEQAQVDWGHFGKLAVGKAERNLSAFVMTLSWSRKIFVCFTFDQKVETLLACHIKAFQFFGGIPRSILYDNMKTVVVERLGNVVRYHEALIEFCEHWYFTPSVCAPYHPESKGRVERSIRYFRGSFFEGRRIFDIEILNKECLIWCKTVAIERAWPDDSSITVETAFLEEQKVLLPLPDIVRMPPRKAILKPDRYGYLHFDRNQYSVPSDVAGQILTLWAYEDEVVIMNKQTEIARHPRTYDAGIKVDINEHREEILKYRNKPRISREIAKLSECLPELQPLMQLWIEYHLDTKALVNFVRKSLELHNAAITRSILAKALEEKAARVEDIAGYLREILQSVDADLKMQLILPANPALRDLTIRSHDLNTYDEL